MTHTYFSKKFACGKLVDFSSKKYKLSFFVQYIFKTLSNIPQNGKGWSAFRYGHFPILPTDHTSIVFGVEFTKPHCVLLIENKQFLPSYKPCL